MGILDWFLGNRGERGQSPGAPRVAARAMVLAAIACRADLERDLDAGVHDLHANEQARHRLVRWVNESDLKSEMEPEESQFLRTPMAQADERAVINAGWRTEGLAVLAWALQLFELPPYDTGTDQRALVRSIGLPRPISEEDPRRSATLRPPSAIGRYASHMTIVNWRLRQFRSSHDSDLYHQAIQIFPSGRTGIGQPMDFVRYLQSHPCYKETWLEGLRLKDGDLALGDTAIADAPADVIERCGSTAVERQIAAYWLRGDHRIYSNVNPATLLSTC